MPTCTTTGCLAERHAGLCTADAAAGARKRAAPERLAPALGSSAKRAARRSPAAEDGDETEEEEASGEVVAEAEGYTLRLSEKSATGYEGVSKDGGRYQARVRSGGRKVHIGYYNTAVEAAVEYARWRKEAGEDRWRWRRVRRRRGW